MNKFDQLVQDLLDGKLSHTHVQIAYRTYIRQREDLPEGIKDILCGPSGGSGLIGRAFDQISEMIGGTELAYRRGAHID